MARALSVHTLLAVACQNSRRPGLVACLVIWRVLCVSTLAHFNSSQIDHFTICATTIAVAKILEIFVARRLNTLLSTITKCLSRQRLQ
jgi:hypothetical protein